MNSKRIAKFRVFFTLLLVTVFLVTSLGISFSAASAQDDASSDPLAELGVNFDLEPSLSADGLTVFNGVRPLVVLADPNVQMQGLKFLQEPEIAAAIANPDLALSTFSITYVAAGGTDAWGEPCYTFPTAAKTAFNAAAAIWASTLSSTVPIKIKACWANLGSSSILGYSGGQPLHRDFTGAPKAGTWYQASLANSLAGSDLASTSFDDHITYNSNFTWYYGTDGNPPAGTYDLVTVAAHEIGHGLNFSGSASYSGGTGSFGYGTGYPVIYDTFMESSAGAKLTSYTNPSAALGSLLTSGSLWFDGPNANAANGGGRVKMYAPGSWAGGSSYSHLDYATFAGTANSMMVYAVSSGSAQHNPGVVAKGLLKDLGWKTSSTIVTVPTLIAPSGTITDTTPTYKFSKLTKATKYEFRTYKGTATTPLYTKTVFSTSCGTTTCTNTPGTVLAAASYKWQARAYIGGVWKAWSAKKSFTVGAAVTGFNSTFTSNASGWTPLNGSWSVAGGFYQTPGLFDKFVTSKHTGTYGILTYTVKLKATGCAYCSHGILFNGTPSPVSSTGRWNKAYGFYITNQGDFNFGYYSGGVWTFLVPWSSYSGITSTNNTLKVTYNKNSGFVQGYINGARVFYGTLTNFTSGQVGLAMYQDSTSRLYVDSAILTTNAPSSVVADSVAEGILIDETVKSTYEGSELMNP